MHAVNDNAAVTYATVCSGIEGPSVAWKPLGWRPIFYSEVAAFPKAVLAHHWPHVPDLGDLTQISGADYRGKVDVLWGSTPCQAFSKAGLQTSLADPRGALTLKFVELADEIDPAFIAWENVKNVLAANDNAFGHFLGALAGEGSPLEPPGGKWSNAGYVSGPVRTVAWRLFDAQHSGLAARRERIFLVGCPTGGADPRDILFERQEGGRYPRPRSDPKLGTNPFTGRPTSVDGPHFFNTDTSPKWADNLAHTLRADSGNGGFQGVAVRGADGELHAFGTTNRMQERMLGFPPDHTLIAWSRTPALEMARRAALGNSVAVPDVRWIGERIAASMAGTLLTHHWPDMPAHVVAKAA